ncbi:MAG: LysR family transcriptional regulator [Ndongobacter sp.]|nr:LysR family transcriptional regulator [Ndongobacter sp.]
MNFQHLQYLSALYNSGSMVEAAAMCFVTQPTISKAVKALEQEFGIEILQRNRLNQIQFTAEGEAFIEKATRILSDYEILRSHFSPGREIRLNISSQHYIFVVEAFLELIKRYDDQKYELQLKEMHTKSIIDEVYNGQSTLGIIYRTKRNDAAIEKYLRERDVEFTEMGMFDFHAFLSIDHRLASKRTLSLAELENYPFVCYSQLDYSQFFLEEGFIPPAKQLIRVCDRDSMYRIMRCANAYTIGTGTLVNHFESEDLISIPIVDLPDKIRVGWIRRSGAVLQPLEEEFLGLCLERLNLHRIQQYQ